MDDLWTTLLPLIIASAILPIQIAVTVLLLRSASGRMTAVAFVAGLITVRLAQGVLFGLVLGVGVAEAEGPERPGPIASTLLLVVGIVFLISAMRKLLKQPDEDEPPPRWMAMVETATPGRAFLLGAGFVAISAKLWAFTLGAIGAIAEAGLGQMESIVTYLVFVVVAASVHLGAIAIAFIAPARADTLMARMADALQRWNRVIMIVLGLVFGVWFLAKALAGLGVL